MDFPGRILRTRQAGVLRLTETIASRDAVFASHEIEERAFELLALIRALW